MLPRVQACLVAILSALCLAGRGETTHPATAPTTATSRPAFTYHSRANGFSLTFPPGWATVPAEELRSDLTRQVKAGADARYTIDAAFYRGESDARDALVDVQVVPYSSNSEPDAAEMQWMMQRFASTDAAGRDLTTRAQRLSQRISQTPPQLDLQSRSFKFEVVVPHPGLGSVRQRMIGHFGHAALLVVTCQAPQRTFDSREAELRQIADSFRFDAAAAHQEGGGQKLSIILITAILAAVYLGLKISLRRRRGRR
jgi:hypothetical protein